MSPVLSYTLAVVLATTSSAAVVYKVQRSRALEAHQLRSEIEQMKRSAFAKHAATTTNSSTPQVVAATVATAGKSAPSYYRNEGQSTPVHTLQTFAWACDQGDVNLMKSLIIIEDAAKPKAAAFYAALPAELRAKAPDVESLAAMLLVDDGMNRPFPRADLLERATVESVGPDLARTRLPGTPRDGGLYQKIGDVWRFVITEQAVDHYIANAKKR